MNELEALAERVEKAVGACRQIDFEILCVVDSRAIKTGPLPGDPKFTGSIDAAMSIVPEGMRDEIEITTLYQVARVTINMNHGADGSPFYGSNLSNSIPLAICAAALKARALAPAMPV